MGVQKRGNSLEKEGAFEKGGLIIEIVAYRFLLFLISLLTARESKVLCTLKI